MVEIADVLEMISNFELIGLRNGPDMTSKEKKIAVATAWTRALSGVSPEDLQEATSKWIDSSPFWPAPAEIRKLCPSVHRKQLEAAAPKETGSKWFSTVVQRCGGFSPNATGSMEIVKGSWSQWTKSSDPLTTGKRNLIRTIAGDDSAVAAALEAGIDAVGWQAFHGDGWRYRENAARASFDRAFNAAFERYSLDHPERKVIELASRRKIAVNEEPEY